MRFRAKIMILAIITVLITSTFYPAWRSYAAEESQGSPTINISGSWVNPYYVDNFTKSQPVKSLRPMEVLTPYSVSSVGSMAELKPVLYQAFTNRETNIQVTYTGVVSDLGDLDDMGNLVNGAGLVSLTNSIIDEDDYLRFNIMTEGIPFSLNGEVGNILITFTPTYFTDLAQEACVDDQVTDILSAIIDPGMNPHQKVKAIHDYIVSHVAYDETLTEHSAYAALFGDKKTVCQGYALLAYKMLEEAGFQARIIGGTANNGSGVWQAHAWNMVKIEDHWYYLDCTWDDPNEPYNPDSVLYTYYNLNDTEIITDHKPDAEYTGLLPSASTTYLAALNNLIAADPNNDIYPRLWQQLGLDYLLPENTAENVSDLKSKILTKALNCHNSQYRIRYYNGSGNLKTTLDLIIPEIASGTGLTNYSWSSMTYNRGGTTGYLLLEFSFTYSVTNTAPTASLLAITGMQKANEILTGTYTYADTETDLEGLSQFQWYRGDNADGTGKIPIPGATAHTYTVQTLDKGKYLFFEVQPIAKTGNITGSKVLSSASHAALESIAITHAAKTSYYVDDPLNISDLVVTGTYIDGSTMIENITAGNITGFSSSAPATNQTLTITVGGKIATYNVKIEAKPVEGCFIATAAFGSKFTWPVALLRHFRDQYLLTNSLGTAFVKFYYQHSPPIAAFIATNQPLKLLVRVLLAPIIAIVYLMYHPLLMGMVLVLLIMFFLYRVRLRKRYVQG